MYLWIKAFHLIAVITWFAALFYLPRLWQDHIHVTGDWLNDEACDGVALLFE